MPETNELEAAADTVAENIGKLISATAFHFDARDITVKAGSLYYAITGEQLTADHDGDDAAVARCKLAELAARIITDMVSHSIATGDEAQLYALAAAVRADGRIPEAAFDPLADIAHTVLPAVVTVMTEPGDEA